MNSARIIKGVRGEGDRYVSQLGSMNQWESEHTTKLCTYTAASLRP